MKALFSLILFLLIAGNSFPQVTYTDILIENSVYSEAPADIQQRPSHLSDKDGFLNSVHIQIILFQRMPMLINESTQ
jgi:hypothetical protein